MAKYNEILTGRHNRFIQKLFGMKGSPPAPQLSGDIQMSHPFFHGAENRILESWNLWGGSAVIPAVAAIVATAQIRMPAGTNVVAVIEKIVIATTGVASEIDLSVTNVGGDLATVIATTTRDTRNGGGVQSTATVSNNTNTNPGSGSVFLRALIPANSQVDLLLYDDQQLVLTPGNIFRLASTVANQNLLYTFFWRERVLEEGERFTN